MYEFCKRLIFGKQTDDSSPFAADVTSIPEQFLRFIPHDSGFSTGPPHWIVAKDDSAQCVDVKRQKLVPAQNILLGAVLFAIGVAVFAYLNVLMIGNNAPLIKLVVLNFAAVVITLCMSLGGVGVYAWMCYSNSLYWKGSLYFRYKLDSQELFFPRENRVYSQKECKRIILGYIVGYDTRRMWKTFGFPSAGGQQNQMSHNTRCQSVVLLQTSTDEWYRYEIGYDLSRAKRQFDKLVSILQPLTNCEVLQRKYSLFECFDEQPKDYVSAHPANKKV
jgi:hypothetical protein